MTLPPRAACAALLLAAISVRAEPAPPAATQPISPTLRVGVETGAGILGGALIGGAAAFTLYSTLGSQQGDDSSRKTAAQVGAAVGVSVGAPIGVSLAGKLLGRDGSFIISWLSSVAGLGVGYGIYGLVRAGSDSSAAKATYALTLLLPVAGAVIGYELTSSAAPVTPTPTAAAGGLQILPVLAVGPGGGVVGLGGTF